MGEYFHVEQHWGKLHIRQWRPGCLSGSGCNGHPMPHLSFPVFLCVEKSLLVLALSLFRPAEETSGCWLCLRSSPENITSAERFAYAEEFD